MAEPPMSVVGRSLPRVDAVAKVTGDAVYGVDIRFPGMLVGRVLRAGVPHARITHVDTSDAARVAGVRAIVTGREFARRHGPLVKDQPALAVDRVRYAGEVVAAVAADDEAAAQDAIERIRVDYDELPVVSDVLAAMEPSAPLIHPDQMQYERADVPGLAQNPLAGTNIAYHFQLRKGDVDAGFAEADLVVEDTFSTPFIQYAHLEPHVTVARWDAEGVMTLWTSTMGPHTVRSMLADLLDLPLTRVRVITPMVGGAYGSKMYLRAIQPATALLAMRLPGRHVRMVFDREDEFLTGHGRLPTVMTVKTGVRKDGTLVARQSRLVWAQGAYADLGAVIARNASYCSLGPYRLPHARIDAYLVYTNRQPGGGFRGLGVPQVAWAGEQQMDRVARELGMDPLELRLRNIYVDGDTSVTGERLQNVGVKACLERAARAIGWQTPLPRQTAAGTLRGRGVACILKSTLTPTASFGFVKLEPDGSAAVITSAVEHGQGAHTVLSQIAAEELRIPMSHVRCVTPDTYVTPYDRSSTSSRTTFHMGNVVRLAAIDVRKQLVDLAASLLEAHADDLVVRDGSIGVRGAPSRSLTYAQVLQKSFGGPGSVLGRASFSTKTIYDPMNPETGQSARPTVFWMYAADAAEVEVDPETGQVRLTRLVSVADAGRAINPLACVQQIEGAAVLGLGMALMEEVALDAGRTLNPTFLDYKVPTTADLPETAAIIVESGHVEGPYGAKGIGESATAPAPAAIGNAVHDAIGVQIKDLPIRAERVYRALHGAGPGAR